MVNTKRCEDVLATLDKLLSELRTSPDSWENPTLEMYLEAMRAWLGAWNNKYHPDPSWDLISDMLEAAKIYE